MTGGVALLIRVLLLCWTWWTWDNFGKGLKTRVYNKERVTVTVVSLFPKMSITQPVM
jgi:hypothetical protein